MSLNRSHADLKNIGKKIVGRLNEVGIFSEDDLKRVGAVEVHRLIRERHPGESLPVCYYLYSFEGALTDKHWGEIGAPRKHQLKTQTAITTPHRMATPLRSITPDELGCVV